MNPKFHYSKAYRDGYLEEVTRCSLALQIRVLREQRGWSQEELASRMGTSQSAVARYEDADYGRMTVNTLLRLREAFDVGLKIEFVRAEPVGDKDLSDAAMQVEPGPVDSSGPQGTWRIWWGGDKSYGWTEGPEDAWRRINDPHKPRMTQYIDED